jgi:Pentapeptide repeats (8 copies)
VGWRDRTGFWKRKWEKETDWEWQPSKTVWDWLGLLIVPTILVLIAFAYSAAQASREHRRADRAAQDAIVLAYLAQEGDLVMKHELVPRSPAAELARALTLATVHRVDGARKAEVVRYLSREGLITPQPDEPIISLDEADLHSVDLANAHLSDKTNLRGADLRGARFDGARLVDTDFSNADLRGASFRGASLGGVVFTSASLNSAVFDGATIGESSLSHQPTSFFGACLIKASFVGAHFSNRTVFTNAQGLEHLASKAQRLAGTGRTDPEPCTGQGPALTAVLLPELSQGCEHLNNPLHDRQYTSGHMFNDNVLTGRLFSPPPQEFAAGDHITIVAGPPTTNGGTPNTVMLKVDDVVVDTAPYEEPVEYVFPAAGARDVAWSIDIDDNAAWSVSCAAPGPATEIAILYKHVKGSALEEDLTTALTGELDEAAAALQPDNNPAAACNPLQAFLNQVAAQRGKTLEVGDAAQLTAGVNVIREQLAC